MTSDHSPKRIGTLFIVPTAIGNSDDLTPRAQAVLAAVDLVLAEDCRRFGVLAARLGLQVRCQPCHDHNERAQTESVVKKLQDGQNIALVSDAGTPLISDPGFALVRECHAASVKVVPLPGACALICALSGSGLPSDRFHFEGFLPPKSRARRTRLQELAAYPHTMIFYEAPHRAQALLEDAVATLGGARRAAWCRELSKTHETLRQDTLSALRDFVSNDKNQRLGEIVLVVAGAHTVTDQGLWQRVARDLQPLLPPREVARLVAAWHKVDGRQVYQFLLAPGPHTE